MKKFLLLILIVLSFSLILICACVAKDNADNYTIVYATGEGGYIDGETTQEVESGKDGSAVIAVPDDGYEFVKWSDGRTEAARQDVNVTADISVTAEFKVTEPTKEYTVMYQADEGGTINGVAEQSVKEGEDGTEVVAVPSTGYKFVEWSDGKTETTRQDKNVTEDISVTAIFEKLTYTLSYSSTEGGYLLVNTSQTVAYGESGEMVTVFKMVGYKFLGWSDGVTTLDRQEINVTTDITVEAIFEKLTFTVTYTVFGNGYIQGNVIQTVQYGDYTEPVTAIAEEGYKFVKWNDSSDNPERGPERIYSDRTFRATFEIIKYTVQYNVSGGGMIYSAPNQIVAHGQNTITVKAVPNRLYEFKMWSDGVTTAERTDVNVQSDIIVTAIFEKTLCSVIYNVSKNSSMGGHYLIEDGTEYIFGEYEQLVEVGKDTKKVTAVPNDSRFKIIGWSDGYEEAQRQEINVTEDLYFEVYIALETKYAVYNGVGGQIIGKIVQVTDDNGTTEPVTAVPYDGYIFAGWSDFSFATTRNEVNVSGCHTYTAYFEPIEKTFKYEYGDDFGTPLLNTVTVNRYNLQETQFIIPEKSGYEFCGWYIDENYQTMIVNETGKLMLGYYTFCLETDTIFARWKNNDDAEKLTYKVLTVAVDSIHTTLLDSKQEEYVDVDYEMSSIERRIILLIHRKVCDWLNEWFNGEVLFEFDIYYTTAPILDADNFIVGRGSQGLIDYSLFANGIAEVSDLIDSYRSVLTYFCMNDFDRRVHTGSGTGSAKYGCIYLETGAVQLLKNDIRYNSFLEEYTLDWESISNNYSSYSTCAIIMETYLHEFTHTIESKYRYYEIYEYHDYLDVSHPIISAREYLLNIGVVGNQIVGIPKNYWIEGGTKMF